MEFIRQEKLNFTDWTELTDEEKKEFNWLENPELSDFFRYDGRVYCTEEFTSTHRVVDLHHRWEGYQGDSYFSGVVVRTLLNDPEFDLEVATYIC